MKKEEKRRRREVKQTPVRGETEEKDNLVRAAREVKTSSEASEVQENLVRGENLIRGERWWATFSPAPRP